MSFAVFGMAVTGIWQVGRGVTLRIEQDLTPFVDGDLVILTLEKDQKIIFKKRTTRKIAKEIIQKKEKIIRKLDEGAKIAKIKELLDEY